ncbi:MAG TPA: translation initiation factor IF-2 [bacterium]|jgi:translation initiation factor IF-2|nr:MAG: Translation initiation factor IF-2 [Parcubacteria group bacterium ADurb.Bin016]HNQ45093.1 translation initiation factor IF-2 [bacterium]HNU89784.1 translation initiation factor IF-2 [bacterium]HPU92082.1 translation initiation factor IF-2 [bacterium]HPX64532.1 translation initiation factor IF-2 [bacterium]
MNITELARRLRVSPQELKDTLPKIGFDIGQRAIKIDQYLAQRIIREWPRLTRELKNREERERQQEEVVANARAEKRVAKIGAVITVKDLAVSFGLPVNYILAELMKNGIFASLNEKIDIDTATIIGSELGIEVVPASGQVIDNNEISLSETREKISNSNNLIVRPPVIVVMGHVDHGKTKLLDAIRLTDVVATEAGGITQHIGAYQITRKDRIVTFVDTPGHEAFTAMRKRGARVADLAILVVAADDGIKPQTIEAYRIIQENKMPFIVAINKIDKTEANVEKVKQELANELGLVPEEWGGKTTICLVSAKYSQGIDELLDTILLLADINAEDRLADPLAEAVGTIIESHVDKSEGPVATILVHNGTLRVGDNLMCNQQYYGKVRALKNYRGQSIKDAGPSTPVKVIGLKATPEIGDVVKVELIERGDKTRTVAKKQNQAITKIQDNNSFQGTAINLLIKTDVYGSGEAIEDSLLKLNNEEIAVRIIYRGLGNITEGDVIRAAANQARIIGFNVGVSAQVEDLAREKEVVIERYQIIYDLINKVRQDMQALMKPEIRRIDLGQVKILAIFKQGGAVQIVGGKVIEGNISRDNLLEIIRNGETIGQGKLTQLQAGRQEVKDVAINQECGLQIESPNVLNVGDILQIYREEQIFKKV